MNTQERGGVTQVSGGATQGSGGANQGSGGATQGSVDVTQDNVTDEVNINVSEGVSGIGLETVDEVEKVKGNVQISQVEVSQISQVEVSQVGANEDEGHV
ncbi:hypothetical protein L1887_05629 [Cichorium endivia]|nr:hypothetical protein L1887_05629 [Cichorium endivia]